jgi:hypothetical protein
VLSVDGTPLEVEMQKQKKNLLSSAQLWYSVQLLANADTINHTVCTTLALTLVCALHGMPIILVKIHVIVRLFVVFVIIYTLLGDGHI